MNILGKNNSSLLEFCRAQTRHSPLSMLRCQLLLAGGLSPNSLLKLEGTFVSICGTKLSIGISLTVETSVRGILMLGLNRHLLKISTLLCVAETTVGMKAIRVSRFSLVILYIAISTCGIFKLGSWLCIVHGLRRGWSGIFWIVGIF